MINTLYFSEYSRIDKPSSENKWYNLILDFTPTGGTISEKDSEVLPRFLHIISHIFQFGPAVSKRGNLVLWSALVARVHPRTADHR